jgi:hypothetical protein
MTPVIYTSAVHFATACANFSIGLVRVGILIPGFLYLSKQFGQGRMSSGKRRGKS